MENWIDPIIEFLLVSSAFLLILGIVSLFVVYVLKIRGKASLFIFSILIMMPLIYPIGTLLPNYVKISIPLEWLQPFYPQAIEPGNATISEYMISFIEADKTSFNKYVSTDTHTSDSQTLDTAIPMPWSKRVSFDLINWKLIIAIAWITLFFLILVRLLFIFKRTKLLLKCSDRVTDPYVIALLKQCSAETGLRRIPRLLMVDRMLIPMAVGLFHPNIILPKKLLEPVFNEGLRFTLLHELKHLQRHDNWWLLIESLVGAAYFFHPIIYWAKQKIHEEWEYICDSHVIQVTNKSVSYADFLLHEIWNHGRERNPSLAVPFILSTRKTTKRVYSILEKKGPTLFTKIRERIAVSLILLSFLSILLCSVTPSAHNKEDNPTDIIINTSESSEKYYASTIIGEIKEPIANLNNNGSAPEQKALREKVSEKLIEVVRDSVPPDPEPAIVSYVPESTESAEKEYVEEKFSLGGVEARLNGNEFSINSAETETVQSVDLASLNVYAEEEPLNPGNNHDLDATADMVNIKGEEDKKEDIPAEAEQTGTSSENVRIPKGARIFRWKAIDDRNIIIMTYFYGNFKATLAEDSPKFSAKEIIGVEAQWPYELDEHSSILLSNGDKCRIEKLVPYSKKGVGWRWDIF